MGERQAFCFDLMELIDISANKNVKEPEKIDETLEYKVGRDGRGFLCSPMSGGKVLARRILLLTGEIMYEDNFKQPVSTAKTGGEGEYFEQVYIIMDLFEKKLGELSTLAETVKMMLDQNVSVRTSDNKIMLTPTGEKYVLLTK